MSTSASDEEERELNGPMVGDQDGGPFAPKTPTLIIIDGGEVETFGDEPDIIDWTYIVGPFSSYDAEELRAIRDRIAQYEGTEDYVDTLNELIVELIDEGSSAKVES